MINLPLFNAMLEKDLIKLGMHITADCRTYSIGASPTVAHKRLRIENVCKSIKTGSYRIIGVDYNNNKWSLSLEDIDTIDGMEPGRFAQVYGLKEDGGTKLSGKKRGRKAKVRE